MSDQAAGWRAWRRLKAPEEVRAGLRPEDGRLLAYGELAAPVGGFAAATQHALVWPHLAAGVRESVRANWDQVLSASWSEEFLDLTLGGPAARDLGRSHRLRFEHPGMLPEVVRERVNWTVVTSQQIRLPDASRRWVLLTARRSTVDSAIRWSTSFDPAAGPVTPAQAAAADRASAELGAQLGIG